MSKTPDFEPKGLTGTQAEQAIKQAQWRGQTVAESVVAHPSVAEEVAEAKPKARKAKTETVEANDDK